MTSGPIYAQLNTLSKGEKALTSNHLSVKTESLTIRNDERRPYETKGTQTKQQWPCVENKLNSGVSDVFLGVAAVVFFENKRCGNTPIKIKSFSDFNHVQLLIKVRQCLPLIY